MLETSVEMCLCTQEHNVLEMRVINMSIDPEESLKDHFNYIHEILRKGYTESTWEDLLIIQLVFDPGHKEVDILASTNFQWSLDVVAISPQVLVFRSSTHRGTTLSCAKLHQYTVQDVDLIIKFDGINCEPLVEILACW
jgi:hypothetical protein